MWDALRRVTDPEYPLSIVDLGMVYGVRVHDGVVTVTVTFTSLGCPAIDMIVSDIREAVLGIRGVRGIEVDVVWDPPWTKERISATGRRILQCHGVVN